MHGLLFFIYHNDARSIILQLSQQCTAIYFPTITTMHGLLFSNYHNDARSNKHKSHIFIRRNLDTFSPQILEIIEKENVDTKFDYPALSFRSSQSVLDIPHCFAFILFNIMLFPAPGCCHDAHPLLPLFLSPFFKETFMQRTK